MSEVTREMFNVEFVPTVEVAELFHTTPAKIAAAIENHTLPIGFVANEGRRRIIIVKKRLEAYINAWDLGA